MIDQIQIHNFTTLSKTQSKLVLKMRNNPTIKKWMYSKNDINYKEHIAYVKSLKTKKDRVYFLVTKVNKNIGVINFTNIDKSSAELGIYANPTLKGQGDTLMKTILGYGFKILNLKIINANVFINNISAINLYKRYNFKKIKANNNLVYMQLKKEDYV